MPFFTRAFRFQAVKPLSHLWARGWGEGAGTRVMLVLCLLTATTTHAQSPLPDWEQLTPEQRQHLTAPTRDRWNGATPEQRARMLSRAERWQQMEPQQRERISGAIDRWQHLPPLRHHELRTLFHHLGTLPEAERAGFMLRWHAMTPEQRREWTQAHPVPPRRKPEHQRTGHHPPPAG